MGLNSTIEWTESTWNPVTGCTKVSPGCLHCYAERMAFRLQAMGQENYKDGFSLSLHENSLSLPLQWKKPKIIFVNSMSDLFHKDIPCAFIFKVFDVMAKASWHRFQLLTKRSDRMASMAASLNWAENIWAGVTVENSDYVNRLDDLRKVPAYVRFASIEPLLGPIPDINLEGIHWVIVGGESGPSSRKIRPEWVRGIRDQCVAAKVPFFFKQWGGTRKKKSGRELDGKVYNEIPETAVI